MKIQQVEESGYTLCCDARGETFFYGPVPKGFTFDRTTNILQVARDLRNFLLRGVQVTLCNGRFEFSNSDDPEALRAHLTAWGTKGKTVEEVEDEIIRWLPTQPKKSKVTLDTWECNGKCIILMPQELRGTPYYLYERGTLVFCSKTLQGALDYARRNS